MIEDTIPYDHRQAHDAAVRACGGSELALRTSCELVELAFQLEAPSLALDMRQTPAMLDIFEANARLALDATLAAQLAS